MKFHEENFLHYVDTPFQSPAILSLCFGMLGIERGLERALGKCRTVAYVEIEAFIIENIISLMEKGLVDAAPVWSNLKTFHQVAHQFRGKVHGITAGYPCQPFSHAGQRAGTEDPRHLFPHICRIFEAVRPVWGYFENVSGHLSMGYDEVYRSLRDMGYAVESGMFTASEVGAPHERERIFILAISNTYLSSCNSGAERLRWETWANAYRSSSRASLADNDGEWEQQPEGTEREIRGRAEYSSEELGNTQSGGAGRLQDQVSEREGYGTCRTSGTSSGYDAIHSPERRTGECAEVGNSISIAGRQAAERGLGVESDALPEGGRHQGANGTGSPDKTVWNTAQFGIQGNGTQGQQFAGISIGEIISGRAGGRNEFPAGPGTYQHDWEAPRTIPSMGCTVNGYNFREDLLRMLGNGVVEQTAAIAFPTLLLKHIDNILR